jgi:hypothetical protein
MMMLMLLMVEPVALFTAHRGVMVEIILAVVVTATEKLSRRYSFHKVGP